FNPIYGATSNPWNTNHTPGGSSGGSAAALAAGLCGLEMGSDIGGSIRVPAHYCGVFGHKPTWGLCGNAGNPATTASAPTDIAVIGPLARSAADLDLAVGLLAGPDPDETALAVTLPPPRPTRISDLRVAVWSAEAGHATSQETTAQIEALADFLEHAGAHVSRSARPAFDATEAFHLYLQLLDAAWSARLTEEFLAEKLLPYGGIVEIVPEDQLLDSARALARSIARHSPVTLELAKRSLNGIEYMELKPGYEFEQSLTRELSGYADSKEAVNAFLEHRAPVYTGR
ncbi:MAG: hypothetical protein J0H57_27040, partial [Rhodospirillales bacterium]|nr:hypothetical protein [Rhodospirillales bacterium]